MWYIPINTKYFDFGLLCCISFVQTRVILLFVIVNLNPKPLVLCNSKNSFEDTSYMVFSFLLLVMRYYYYYALLVNSCWLLARSRSKPINISSVSLALGNSLYSNETICAWLLSSIFLPLLVVNLDVLTKTPGPKLVNRTSIPSAYLLSVAVCDTSKFKSR